MNIFHHAFETFCLVQLIKLQIDRIYAIQNEKKKKQNGNEFNVQVPTIRIGVCVCVDVYVSAQNESIFRAETLQRSMVSIE